MRDLNYSENSEEEHGRAGMFPDTKIEQDEYQDLLERVCDENVKAIEALQQKQLQLLSDFLEKLVKP